MGQDQGVLRSGRRFRAFRAIGKYNREALRIEVNTILEAARVIRAPGEVIEVRGAPLSTCMGKGPEFISNSLAGGAKGRVMAL